MTGERVTDTEQVFACEAAADSYRASGYVYDVKQIRVAFLAGWEAAMEWVRGRSETRNEEEPGYPSFSHGGMPLG